MSFSAAFLVAAAVQVLAVLPIPPSGGGGTPTNNGAVAWTGSKETVTDIDSPTEGSTRGYTMIPSSMYGSTLYLLSDESSAGQDLTVSCTGDAESICLLYVVVLHCAPCSVDVNGGLPGQLLEKDWVAYSCGPRYVPDMGDVEDNFGTITFRKTLNGGDSETFTTTKGVAHVGVFTRARLCPDFAMSGCGDYCSASGITCIETPFCPEKPHGPVLGGAECTCPTADW